MHRICSFLFALIIYTLSLQGQQAEQGTKEALRSLGATFYKDCHATLLPTAQEKFQVLFDDIRQARKYIHLDYFKFQDDSICSELFILLAQKVREGVCVRVLYDAIGNQYSDLPLRRPLIDSLRAQGIRIFAFDRMRFPWIHHFVHRNHHKIAVIDGTYVYTGGMNVADYYLHGKPKIGEWRDMHMRLTGPIVEGFEHIFEVMWFDASGELLAEGSAYNEKHASQHEEGNSTMALVSRMPRHNSDNMRNALAAAIDNAEEIIQIVNPYSTLTHTVRKALYHALERGVRLQYMVSYKGDANITQNVQAIEMRKLMKRGAEIYYYEGGFHHGKVMMIDNRFCCVGTTNMDGRSLRNDYEVSAFIFDVATTHQLQSIFQKDIEEHCFLLTPSVWKERFTVRERMSGRFFTPIRSSL